MAHAWISWAGTPRGGLERRQRGGSPLLVLVALAIALVAGTAQATAQSTSLSPTPAATSADTRVIFNTLGEPVTVPAHLVQPGDMGAGALLFEAEIDGLYVQAPEVATDVQIDVTGPIARTKVTQRFQNPGEGWVEGIYVFPLPDDSAVDTLRMQIGDRFIEGKIKEREEARQIYEQAKAEGFKASLVEQERPNLFTNSVANIGPGETIVVQIEYQQTVTMDDGLFSLRFPMVVAPRYSPEPEIVQTVTLEGTGFGVVSDPVPDRDRIESPVVDPRTVPKGALLNPVTLSVRLNAGFPLDEVASSYHEVVLRRDGAENAAITLKEGEVEANKDFELTWTPRTGANPTAALFKETVAGEDYLLLMLVPPKGEQVPDPKPREVIFVIDNSGSMSGPSMDQAKQSLGLALARLRPQDRFNVIRFNHETQILFPSPVPATADNIGAAREAVNALEADGGTEMLSAMQAALTDLQPNEEDRLRQVIFLTDGAIGNEAELFQAISDQLGRSRLFPIGIGSAPNSYFMSRAARMGRGTFTQIGDVEQVSERTAKLYEKIERPIMTEVSSQWPAAALAEVWPNPLPDLYGGEPVVLTAKMPTAEGTVRITGVLDESPWAADVDLAQAVEGKGVSKLWARRKIAGFEEARFEGLDWESVDRGVLAVALEHHLVSRLTSLVAVDVTPSRPEGEALQTAEVPLALPEGWDFDKVFGEDPGLLQERIDQIMEAAAADDVQFASLKIGGDPTLAAATDARGAPLPMGSTPAPLLILLGALLVLTGSTAILLLRRRERSA